MRLLFDQNLSRKLVGRLADIFPNSTHVQFLEMTSANDNEIWELAKLSGFIIVTQDADFAEKSRLYDSPPKVIWLRGGNTTTNKVEFILRSRIEVIKELSENPILHCLELY
ncbi:DUF5615 family PIN-like protein [Geminocystis sp. GBBB08]|uniref:DUF5615 family PIN-like protein n=1 Tax=Geminocystis sp. GBBB08 TaxID=2604140 RepID=UPI0027E3634C|nr:DUF5615 family PIN-like protein [Geminocystis sp. GBBB08]MBL1208405.1 hypothetical protein [Geminocystis sp. GBBB08]